MKKNIIYFFLSFSCFSFSQIGIETNNPQQDLHIAGATSTIRIESLNSINEPALNDGTKLAPLYVNANGDFTLAPSGFTTGGGVGTNAPLNFLISVPNFVPNGPFGDGTVVANDITVTSGVAEIVQVPFTSPQDALIEVRYAMTIDLSDQFLPAPAGSTFNDISARAVRCYFYIDLNSDGLDAAELSKKYGLHGEAYTSFAQGSIGYAFIHGVGYGNIPAGNHRLVFYGETQDGNNRDTYVGFGGSSDYLKIRIYN
ncbi:hypothetical protein [Flavobacterium cheniae]|jgi:hypothetical protein|uniref:Uncharacterized protein n=1 Tax=Flavobacterium cheniae TaxID=295428 RepID=A0A562KH56_9FLAO|nr:hypothetical protein [Flavobacterium cheniae]TDR24457.1 hypothetical protein C8D80_1498 [Flavobacterium cheniae]TWH94712.1 hypothetical protein IP97_01424 [Flavobacterium cheniae]